MPGLSQLKKFSSDLLSLGDEINLRAARGEKPVTIEIPDNIEDKNDSEEFVLGMPENEVEVEVTPVDEDLSDLTALVNPATEKKREAEPAPTFEAPDMSALLNPVAPPADDETGMPDLSMFDEVEEEPEPEVEEEPEEVSIADMGLDALLAGGGFDEPQEPEIEEPQEKPEIDLTDFEEISDLDDIGKEEPTESPVEEMQSVDSVDSFEEAEPAEPASEISEMPELSDFDLPDDLGELTEPGDSGESFTEPAAATEPQEELETAAPAEESAENLELGEFDEPLVSDEQAATLDSESSNEVGEIGDLGDLGALGELTDFSESSDSNEPSAATELSAENSSDFDAPTDFDIPEMPEDFGEELQSGETESLEEKPEGNLAQAPLDETELSPSDFTETESATSENDLPASDVPPSDFSEPLPEDIPSLDTNDSEINDLESESLEEPVSESADSESEPADFSLPEEELSKSDSAENAETGAELGELGDLGDLGDLGNLGDLDSLGNLDEAPSTENETSQSETSEAEDVQSSSPAEDELAGTPPAGLFDVGDLDFENPTAPASDLSADEEIPDFDDNADLDDSSFDEENSGEPLEIFDTSEMEGMDFGIQDTDSQLGGDGNDFELGETGDFAMEGEFEIPGFSDVATAKEEKSSRPILSQTKDKGKKGKGKNLPEPDFTGAQESEDLPPNTLSDEQYKTFLANLAEYPLNVRLAFEDFIVQDEFTDDAEFEIIEKILNKAPARQIAGMLEKMLDTSIPIPRDFEHRTAAEYEAYKKSLSYQLRNKIIPGILLGIVLTIVGWGLYKFGDYCIYRPISANSLYKQGYALLEADEYPQAEERFNKAKDKRINKKWFFKYARGYREHKQYQRAGNMYQNILRYFKHDKLAGLEYADMELNDLANYERAEEIVRREVLDYHINDPDGILKLGDVFLEWGTEKDPSKFELAREQYATLIQLYKPTDLYLSRMMRYFIRTDNLREVLQLKKNFDKREKSLGSEDWAELSGYLLDKYYGTLAPSEEYLRYEIEGLRGLLLRAVKTNPNNPIALYNLSKYFIQTNETGVIEPTLQAAIEKFNNVSSIKRRDLYKYIDSYRLLGEHYITASEYLQAQEQFAEGISLFTTERDNAGFVGTPAIGKLYEDMGNIKYTISGDYDDALFNYKYSVELENDSPSLRYRIGFIQYKKKNYAEALGAFMKAGDGNIKERNLMLAMANTLYLRGDDYAAEGYYDQLIDSLDNEIAESGLVLPQANEKDYDLINTYLYAANNYGVTLYKLAKRTGNSALNAQAIVQLSQSVRAWDALTRNQQTMVRLGGSNLAEQNIKYITHPIPEFEPSVYTDISKTLLDNERL